MTPHRLPEILVLALLATLTVAILLKGGLPGV